MLVRLTRDVTATTRAALATTAASGASNARATGEAKARQRSDGSKQNRDRPHGKIALNQVLVLRHGVALSWQTRLGCCSEYRGWHFRYERRLNELERRSEALRLADRIISPKQPRGDRSPRSPSLRDVDHLLWFGPRFEAKGVSHRVLQGEVAWRPGIGSSQAEQDVDVGRPRPDTLKRRQLLVDGHFGRVC